MLEPPSTTLMMIWSSTELRPKRRRTSPRFPRSHPLQLTSTKRRWLRVDSRSPPTASKPISFQEPKETKDHKPLEVVAVEEAAEVEEEMVRSHSDQTPEDKLPPTRMVSKSKTKEVETENNLEERTVIENPAWEEVLSSQDTTEKSQRPSKEKVRRRNQRLRKRRRLKSQSRK